MNNCLFTQLKAATNNPNLPLIEVMLQITLNAIELSGNSTMTDNQKCALNHFYYQLGAAENSSLWQKIQGIIMPFLANDAAHSIADYKSNTIYNPELEATFSFNSTDKSIKVNTSGGQTYVHQMLEFNFETDDFSIIQLFPEVDNLTDNYLYAPLAGSSARIGKKNGATSVISGIYTSNSDYLYRYYKPAQIGVVGQAFSFGNESSLIHGFYLDNNNAIENYTSLPSYDSGTTYPSQSDSKIILASMPTRGFIVGKAMTTTELSTVFNSLTALRAAFIS